VENVLAKCLIPIKYSTSFLNLNRCQFRTTLEHDTRTKKHHPKAEENHKIEHQASEDEIDLFNQNST